MKTIRDDNTYDPLVATYQSLEGSILNAVLKENGIVNLELRRKIIGDFLFGQGVTLDQCWFKEDGSKWFPGVFFSTLPHHQIESAEIMLPGDKIGSNFHEYALGAADLALENEDDNAAIKTGSAYD